MVDEQRPSVAQLAAGLLATGRLVLGTAFVARPRLAAPLWLGPAAAGPGGAVAGRAVGIRELVLGSATLLLLNDRARLQRWAALQIPVDAIDLMTTVRHRGELPRSGALVGGGLAAAAVACGVAAAASR